MYALLGHNSTFLPACYLPFSSHSSYRWLVLLLRVISANPCLPLLQFPLACTCTVVCTKKHVLNAQRNKLDRYIDRHNCTHYQRRQMWLTDVTDSSPELENKRASGVGLHPFMIDTKRRWHASDVTPWWTAQVGGEGGRCQLFQSPSVTDQTLDPTSSVAPHPHL